MGISINVIVNGREIHSEVEPRTLLVQWLRNELKLTGTHIGCDTSSCGACTILLDGKAIKSCTLLAVQADGGKVTTIEGMAGKDALHPLQEAFNECHGLQCGFCTPGIIMNAAFLLSENPDPSESEIRASLEGNFCRCTGYQNIVKAIQYAASKMQSTGKMKKEVAI